MIDEFTDVKQQLKQFNKLLVKGNPCHPSFVNGFSILTTTNEIERTELSWIGVLKYLEKLKAPMNELDFYRLLKQYLPRHNQVTEDLVKEVDNRLSILQQREEVAKWNELCILIEQEARNYEAKYQDLVDVTITCDNSEIVITNNLYNNWIVI